MLSPLGTGFDMVMITKKGYEFKGRVCCAQYGQHDNKKISALFAS